MSQNLFLSFPLPVALALAASLLVLCAVARVLASLSKPVTIRQPQRQLADEANRQEASWRH